MDLLLYLYITSPPPSFSLQCGLPQFCRRSDARHRMLCAAGADGPQPEGEVPQGPHLHLGERPVRVGGTLAWHGMAWLVDSSSGMLAPEPTPYKCVFMRQIFFLRQRDPKKGCFIFYFSCVM